MEAMRRGERQVRVGPREVAARRSPAAAATRTTAQTEVAVADRLAQPGPAGTLWGRQAVRQAPERRQERPAVLAAETELTAAWEERPAVVAAAAA
jgi:hypothetical protein